MVEGMPDLFLVAWSLVIFVFAVIEYYQLNGNYFPIAVGGAGGFAAWLLQCTVPIQAAAFAVATVIAYLVLRPLFKRVLASSATSHMEGLDLLVGLEGKVISKIDGQEDPGRVDIDGRPVKAVPVDPQQKYNVGDRIVVTALDGDVLVVKKARKHK